MKYFYNQKLKNLCFNLSFIIIIQPFTLFAQWEWQNPKPQGNTLSDISFYNDNVGLCVGNTGTIMKTINSGVDWRIIETGFTDNLKKVEMLSELVAYAMGSFFIKKSTDAGETWFEITGPPLNYFTNFCFIDQDKWYVVGTDNKIFFTSDGGVNWIPRSIGLTVALKSIDFFNESTGMATGYIPELPYDEHIILKTTDGGLSWSSYIFSSFSFGASDMIFLTELKTFIVGSNKILKTTDGGTSWSWVNFSSGSHLLSIDFHDFLNGYISCVNKIIITSDGGNTWIEKNLNLENNIWLYGISNPSQNLVFAVGLHGRMVISNDNGITWNSISGGFLLDFNDVAFFDELHGIAVGGGSVVTTDGGRNWITTQGGGGYRCSMPSKTHCFSAGGYNLAKSTDGGFTWIRHPISNDNYFMTISFVDTLNGIATTMSGSYPKIFRTFDGGENWQHITTLGGYYLYDICFIDSITIYACGNGVLKSTDGGYNWIAVNSNVTSLGGIHFINTSIGYAVGNQNIIKTTDAGMNWILVNNGVPNGVGLEQVSFIDENNGIAAGNWIVHTSDGGTTWQTHQLLGDYLKSGAMISDSVWYAVGQFGSILKHKSGIMIPVELISFTATTNVSEVILNWSTATETNNSGFEILRSTKKDGWNKIGFVPGHGTTTEIQHYSFTDKNVKRSTYLYKIKQIDYDGTFQYSNIVEVVIGSPTKFSLKQNYPNPFNPSTIISWQSPVGSWQTLKIYDILGNEVATLVNEELPAGEYEVEFSAIGGSASGGNPYTLSSGIYFYQLKAGAYVQTKKMVFLK